jgi:hypothetical protein
MIMPPLVCKAVANICVTHTVECRASLLFCLQACAALAIALGAAGHIVSQRHSRPTTASSLNNTAVCPAAAAAQAAQPEAAGYDDSARPMTASEQVQKDAGNSAKHKLDMPSSSSSSSCHHHQQDQQMLRPHNGRCSTSLTSAVTLHIDVSSRSSSRPEDFVRQHEDDPAVKLQRQRSIQLGSNSRFLGLAVALLGEQLVGSVCLLWS